MTDDQVAKASRLQRSNGFPQVQIVEGRIEALPFDDASFDAVLSNGVINLSPAKDRVFAEAARVLRPGGRLAFADIVSGRPLKERTRRNVELWAACIAGAIPRNAYLQALEASRPPGREGPAQRLPVRLGASRRGVSHLRRPEHLGARSQAVRGFPCSHSHSTRPPPRRSRRRRRSSSTSPACTRAPASSEPDFIAVVDAETGAIVHETPMPNVGDELHHFGWNRCSSACHGPDRSHLIVPGFRSSRIHILNVADDPRRPRIEKVIEPDELIEKTGYTRPHTVHCMPGGNVVISMLGDRDGNGAGGFAVLDAATLRAQGPLGERRPATVAQLRLLVPAAQERARLLRVRRPQRVRAGLRPGRRRGRPLRQPDPLLEPRGAAASSSLDLGEAGLVPLEVRWLHDPDAESGFVGAALSSTIMHFERENGGWAAEQVIGVEAVPQEGWPFPVPGLITDIVLSMDDRFLYLSNWLHGDLRQYDISDPTHAAADRAGSSSAACSAARSTATASSTAARR